MNLNDITIVTAIDTNYIDKLLATYRTWLYFKSEITAMPLRIIYDSASLSLDDCRMRRLCCMAERHRDFQLIPWDGQYDSQREKMLTSLVFGTATCVQTPWYLKIDADTIATANKGWVRYEWFDGNPAFITNPWGYTKPPSFIDRLEAWGDTVPALAQFPRLGIPIDPNASKVRHSRIISWLYFGNTAWTKEMASFMPLNRLPVPSQDTTLWYCAARTRQPFVTYKMKRLGWGHLGRKSISFISDTARSLINE